MAGAEVTPGHRGAWLGKGRRDAIDPGAMRVFAGGAQSRPSYRA
jgi:hypothetical protein